MKIPSIAAVSLVLFAYACPLRSLTASPTPSPASDGAEEAEAAAAGSTGKTHAVPFRGTVATFDDRTRTFTLAGKGPTRSLKITDKTAITKGGNPATTKDIVANEEVRGSYFKMSDGSMEAKTVKLGPLTEAEKAQKEARKEKREAKKASPTP